MAEDGGEAPWKDGVVHTEIMDSMVAAILECSGPTDTAVVFDGGSAKVRRKLEEQFEANPWKNVRQVTIVYFMIDNTGWLATGDSRAQPSVKSL